MRNSYAHIRESTESLSASSLSLLLQILRLLFESFRFLNLVNSVFFRRPECTPSSANHRLDSVRISMGERREHRRTS